MSVRRPRLKAAVNLGSTRKPTKKPENITDNNDAVVKDNQSNVREQSIILEEAKETIEKKFVPVDVKPSTSFGNVQEPPSFEPDDSTQNSCEVPENTLNKENDAVFKSPMTFSSSTSQSVVRPNPNDSSKVDDYLKFPMSPTKIRQRIKATPIIGKRRRSIQEDEASESGFPKRQRHLSTSSTHSNHSVNMPTTPRPPNGVSVGGGRIRTESICSNASDISVIKDIAKNQNNRRTFKSEETQKIEEKRRNFRDRFQNQTPDKAQLRMYDMIYYNPVTNPMKSASIKEERRGSSAHSVSSFGSKASAPRSMPPPPPPSKKEEIGMPVPQLKIGANGEIIIDEKSLVIETTYEKEARQTLANADVVYDDEFNTSHGFYKRQQRTKDWNLSETIKFYRCLHTIGTDFSMMVSLFPNRSRRDLKVKFKKEERLHSQLINKVLCNPKAFNIEQLEQDLKKSDEEEEQTNEQNAIKEQIIKVKEKRQQSRKSTINAKKNNPQKVISSADRVLTDGEFVYDAEQLLSKSQTPIKVRGKAVVGVVTPPSKTRSKSVKKQTVETEQEIEFLETSNAFDYDVSNQDDNLYDPNSSAELGNQSIEIEDNYELQNSAAISSISLSDSVVKKILDDNYQLLNMDDFTTTNIDQIEHFTSTPEKVNKVNQIQIVDDYYEINDDYVDRVSDDDDLVSIDDTELKRIKPERCPIAEPDKSTIPKQTVIACENDKTAISMISTPQHSTAGDTSDSDYIYVDQDEPRIKSEKTELKRESTPKVPPAPPSPQTPAAVAPEDDLASIIDQLVVVVSQHPTNPGETINEIFLMCPTTGRLSEKPLDLPPEIIQTIVASQE